MKVANGDTDPERLRFETLRVGQLILDEAAVFDVRLVRASHGMYHITVGSSLGPGHATAVGAIAAMEGGDEVRVAWRADLVVGGGDVPCPTCSAPLDVDGGTPGAVCPPCVHEAVDGAGRALRFTSDGAGVVATLESGERGDAVCWVRGVRCRARGSRFGGFAVVPEPG